MGWDTSCATLLQTRRGRGSLESADLPLPFFHLRIFQLPMIQGDQTGRIFALWVSVYFGKFSKLEK
jgi:hypothetical protein